MTAMPGLPYPDTQYSRTLAARKLRPAAEGRITADVAVIGGGLAGLTLARELAAAGRAVVLLEAEAPGFGASGRNGGFVSPGYAAGQEVIARRAGRETADALFALSLEGVDYVRARADSYGPDCGIALQNGLMSVRRRPGGEAELRAAQEDLARFGYHTEFLDRETVRSRTVTAKYFAALRSDRAFHIHPLNYARALADEAERLGARLYDRSAVIGIGRGPQGPVLRTNRARIEAGAVVVTTGGYTGALVPRLRRAFVPVATYVLASEPAPALLASAIRTDDGIGDHRRAGDYYRLTEGRSRLVWGGAITVRDRDPAGVAAYLRRGMLDTYPQLRDLRVAVSWSGWMSYARHQMPQIGRIAPDLWYATAFGGHGLNTTVVGACLVAEGLTGLSDRWRLFAPFGLDWTGGPLGKAAAQATYWWLQWQDRRAEAAAHG